MNCRRVIFGTSIIVINASLSLVACVGDDPTTASNVSSDAATAGDATIGTDAAANDGSSTTVDASDAAVETFDGAYAYCNDFFPQDAPDAATIECDGGSVGGSGGAILPGKYFLVDEKFQSCPAGVPAPYSDVIDIRTAADGGVTVNAALNGPNAFRVTLAWAPNMASPYFDQYDVCPADGRSMLKVPYTATADGKLEYFLPAVGNLSLQRFAP